MKLILFILVLIVLLTSCVDKDLERLIRYKYPNCQIVKIEKLNYRYYKATLSCSGNLMKAVKIAKR